MNRTDRLLAIVLELQGRGQQRAEDLANTFEVSKRTIYRDMQALSEAGVPIVSMTGQGYSLMEGYFLPPLSFGTDEAFMLVLGCDFVAQNFDAQYRTAAHSVRRKIEAVLPDGLREDVNSLRESITFFATNTSGNGAESDQLRRLRRAIIERKVVRVHYCKRFTGDGENAQSVREIDPYGLAHLANDWYLMAYCRLRRAIRIFRLSRIDHLVVLEKTFTRPADFKLNWSKPNNDRNLVVRALFDREVARWVQESRSFFVVEEEETPEGLLVTLKVRTEREVFQWLLGWGSHVRVLEPASLRRMLAEEAEKVLQNHRETALSY